LTAFRFLGPVRLLAVLLGVYRVGCDCGTPSNLPDGGNTADSGIEDGGAPDSGTTDGGVADSGTPDSGAADSGCDLVAPACGDPRCLGVACGTHQICTSLGQCACAMPVSAVAASQGRASILEVAGRPRVAFFTDSAAGSQFEYTECTAACDTPDASWTPPVLTWPDAGDTDVFRYPAFAFGAGVTAVAGYRVGGSNLTYAECDGGCTIASNWSSVILDALIKPSTSVSATTAIDMATVGATTYRALTTIARASTGGPSSNAATYAECTGPTCLDIANWHVAFVGPATPIFGTGVVLRPEGAQLHRYVAYGASTAADFLQYGECVGTCAASTDWLPLTVLRQQAQLPSLAVSSAGVPRIAYYDLATAAVRYTWCTSAAPPCTTAAQWSDVPLASGGQVLSLKVGADDRARIAFTDGASNIQLAIETSAGSGVFNSAPITDCVAALSGGSPALLLGPQDRYRAVFLNGQTVDYTQQSP
jgi:hypothetical protein